MVDAMRNIWDLEMHEVEALFKYAKDFNGFKITRLERTEPGCLDVYAESKWGDDNDSFAIEDLIVELYADGYKDMCDFSNGFSVDNSAYVQWALWCDFIEKINFTQE